jgi:hypothetical protein
MPGLPTEEDIAGADLSVGNNATVAALQKYVKHDKAEFDEIRNTIKQTTSMFMFGLPTTQMMSLLIKVYHENLVRIAYRKLNPDSTDNLKYSCMFGLLESTTGELYCTISETAAFKHGNHPTDKFFMEKRAMMINILRNAGINVNFPESSTSLPAKKVCPAKYDNASAFVNYRETNREGNPLAQYETQFPTINTSLKDAVLGGDLGTYSVTGGRKRPGKNAHSVYDSQIRQFPMTVNWIDSCEYLDNRSEGGPTFRPFKKYRETRNKSLWQSDCNNGHLCTESKLFAYATYNNISTKSFVAYWVGNNMPTYDCADETKGCHVIESYCYNIDSKQLKDLVELCQPLVKDTFRRMDEFSKVLPYIVRPMAVACPGCFANIRNYLAGKNLDGNPLGMTQWNTSNCYYPRRGLVGGKKTRRRTRKHRKCLKF